MAARRLGWECSARSRWPLPDALAAGGGRLATRHAVREPWWDSGHGREVAMRVGMVGTAAGEPSVAVGREGGWVPLLTVPGADRLGPVSADLLAFLSAGEQVRELAEELVSAAPSAEPSPRLAPPFRPLAFRDCSLWEEHIPARPGHAGRRGPRQRRRVGCRKHPRDAALAGGRHRLCERRRAAGGWHGDRARHGPRVQRGRSRPVAFAR